VWHSVLAATLTICKSVAAAKVYPDWVPYKAARGTCSFPGALVPESVIRLAVQDAATLRWMALHRAPQPLP
jgi:hypothetical protein